MSSKSRRRPGSAEEGQGVEVKPLNPLSLSPRAARRGAAREVDDCLLLADLQHKLGLLDGVEGRHVEVPVALAITYDENCTGLAQIARLGPTHFDCKSLL